MYTYSHILFYLLIQCLIQLLAITQMQRIKEMMKYYFLKKASYAGYLLCYKKHCENQLFYDFMGFFFQKKISIIQESLPAWMQEVYRPLRSQFRGCGQTHKQTRDKTLPSPILRMQAVIMLVPYVEGFCRHRESWIRQWLTNYPTINFSSTDQGWFT